MMRALRLFLLVMLAVLLPGAAPAAQDLECDDFDVDWCTPDCADGGHINFGLEECFHNSPMVWSEQEQEWALENCDVIGYCDPISSCFPEPEARCDFEDS